MAPVYDFRHVELDKIGRGKRIVKPPGGECSDIFGVQDGVVPHSPDQLTPRKSNNYMQSTIFSPDSPDSSNYSNHSTPATTPSKLSHTAQRLFGSPEDNTPRKIINRQRSSIFEEEVSSARTPNVKSANTRRPTINPITGAPFSQNGTSNGSHNGTPNGTPNGTFNGIMNGTPNGTHNGSVNGYSNGTCNGHSSPESPVNGTPRSRIPPGGKSSGIF